MPKDKTPPVIGDIYPTEGLSISKSNTTLPVSAYVTDTEQVFQVILQIDPIGSTYLAPNSRNKAFWQGVDFYKQGDYTLTASIQNITVGEHKFRVTAFDANRNRTTKEITFTITE